MLFFLIGVGEFGLMEGKGETGDTISFELAGVNNLFLFRAMAPTVLTNKKSNPPKISDKMTEIDITTTVD